MALICVAATSAHADKASNPAFLGVGMNDAGGARGAGPCVINRVENGSGAEAARLRPGDVFAALDGHAVPNCDALVSLIQTRAPGSIVSLAMRRNETALTVRAELLTRDEVLRRRLVGQPAPATALIAVEDRKEVDLSLIKQTTIIGWYPSTCTGCEAVLQTVGKWARERQSRRSPIALVAATASDSNRSIEDTIASLRLAQRSLDLPLLVAEPRTYEQFAIADADRVSFLVIDCRGMVQYASPVVPNVADTEAVLDELFAAAEQTARRASR
jgi:membrane-associated protease RseP (regulator of RpoE activity)